MKNLIILLILGIASCSLANGCVKDACMLEKTGMETAMNSMIESGSEDFMNKWNDVCNHDACKGLMNFEEMDTSCPMTFMQSVGKKMVKYTMDQEAFNDCVEGLKGYIFWDIFNPEKVKDAYSHLKNCFKSFIKHEKTQEVKGCMAEVMKFGHGMKEHWPAVYEMVLDMGGTMGEVCKKSMEDTFWESMDAVISNPFEPTGNCIDCKEDFVKHCSIVSEKMKSPWMCSK